MKKEWGTALVAMVIFSSGLAAGHSLSGLRAKAVGQRDPRRAEGDRRGGPAVQLPGAIAQRLEFVRKAQKELDLTPEQRARVEGHLDVSRERIRKLWEPVIPQVRAETDALKRRIRAELTPAQAERFDRLLKVRTRRGEFRDRHAGHASDRPLGLAGEEHPLQGR